MLLSIFDLLGLGNMPYYKGLQKDEVFKDVVSTYITTPHKDTVALLAKKHNRSTRTIYRYLNMAGIVFPNPILNITSKFNRPIDKSYDE